MHCVTRRRFGAGDGAGGRTGAGAVEGGAMAGKSVV